MIKGINMKGKLPVKIPDIVIILMALGLTLFSVFAAYARTSGAALVLIQGPDRTWVFPLDAEETVRVRGILGDDTVVRIHGGEAWAESSPCYNQLCVGMGRINANSWWGVACLPNNVFFMVERSYDRGSVDATVW
jgi:hypothetical protein